MEKYLYIIDYWLPFPDSEYGGLFNVIASSDEECYELLREDVERFQFHSEFIPDAKDAIRDADKFLLADSSQESRIVREFTT